jgi:tetratricopeptide (TPR) repeat protein
MRSLTEPARSLHDSTEQPDVDSAPTIKNQKSGGGGKTENRLALPPSLPLVLNARDLIPSPSDLRFVDVPAKEKPASAALKKEPNTKGGAVLRGIKDLQQLQKQTIAVLEAVKGSLDEIAQVLRSPEATRGMEKQQNAATLLAKGFAREAIEQAQGAAALLPANPEAHLLLSLALAADQQFEHALGAARKGIALFDRRCHPLAIEAGLLHALAALGCGLEAVDRWTEIIDALPLPVLFEHMGRIASCFPSEINGGGEALLDDLFNRRLARDDQNPVARNQKHRRRTGTIHILPDEIPAPALFAGLDAAKDFKLPNTHRAILGLIARRLQLVQAGTDPGAAATGGEGGRGGEVIKFITECVIPLGNRGLERTAESLGRAAVRRLYRLHADAMMLHRALGKLEMAGGNTAIKELKALLNFWRKTGNKVVRAKRYLGLSLALMATGLGVLAYVLWGLGALAGKTPMVVVGGYRVQALWVGPGILALGAFLGFLTMLRRTWNVPVPEGRGPLTRGELAYLNSSAVRKSLR